ncbi:MAG: FAD-dependent monooxygenase [Anaerolineales bacterium]|nr:FAD-dependent monooxygenase [Anaerolineales bacterium]
MPNQHSTAIILGASMSGLLAARALSEHFEHITVVERDKLPEGSELRKGVPQAAHAHGLLASGYRVMDEYFPGMMDELEALGAVPADVVGDFLWFQYGRWKLRHASGFRGMIVSRPCLEAAIRQRVKALSNVTFLEGADGVKPTLDVAAGRVTGLVVRQRDRRVDETLDGNLVIDASGRGSRSPKWLEELGYGRPKEIIVKVDVGYATRTFERQPGEFFNSLGGIIAGTPPAGTRLGAAIAAEGNRWVVSLAGVVGDYPPTDEAGWVAFAETLPEAAIHELVTSARPLTDIVSYRFPANQRRLYERMRRFPSGYLVIGDAVCSFNPIYGQGMSVAATEAKALDDCLAKGLDRLSRRFYARTRKIVEVPWTIATGEDLRFPQVDGRRSTGYRIVNRYLERVHAVASEDPTVCREFFQVANLLAPPTRLLSPRVAWRVLARSAPKGRGSPWSKSASPATLGPS